MLGFLNDSGFKSNTRKLNDLPFCDVSGCDFCVLRFISVLRIIYAVKT